ncbi:MAG: DASH family cryptochrome [Cytophagales bacterium]|nr:DASH family cryptochrome [Cytophagales bacterium]MDW8384474.1 DASH family cryptochrome [Flammeovirgaceae bacterium]
MKTIIVWYRNDLRIHDHVPLFRAFQKTRYIVPVYCFDPRLWEKTSFGFPKTGGFRTRFLLESVADLQKNIASLGGCLIVRYGKPEEVLPEIAQKTNASAVYASKEIASEEVKVEQAVEKKLLQNGIPLQLFWNSSLYHPEDLPFPIKKVPDVFTNFRKEVEKFAKVPPPVPTPEKIETPPTDSEKITYQPSWNVPLLESDARTAFPFRGGESRALVRLQEYFWQTDALRYYKDTRNGLIGPNYSSKFSPWLANGCLSTRLVYHKVLQYEKERFQNESTYWLIFELLWRDYFRWIAKKYGNAIFRKEGIKQKPLNLQDSYATFEKWAYGNTGVPFVDANMKELLLTGFMSNRGRQNVASFLVHDLKVNWVMGAEWFESWLIDYDVYSNWGNWNYIAGVGNDPRENRYFNIERQAQTYDPDGKYVRLWLSEKNQPAQQAY